MKERLAALAFFLAVYAFPQAPGSELFVFGLGARAISLSGGASLSGTENIFFNPAIAAEIRRVSVSFSTGGFNAKHAAAGAAVSIPTAAGVFSFGGMYLRSPEASANSGTVGGAHLGYGIPISDMLFFGAGLRGYYGYEPTLRTNDWGLSFDIGLYLRTFPDSDCSSSSSFGIGLYDLAFGIALRNAAYAKTLTYGAGHVTPVINLGLGASAKIVKLPFFTAGINADMTMPISPFSVIAGGGIELGIADTVFLRGGALVPIRGYGLTNALGFTAGIGVKARRIFDSDIMLDIALLPERFFGMGDQYGIYGTLGMKFGPCPGGETPLRITVRTNDMAATNTYTAVKTVKRGDFFGKRVIRTTPSPVYREIEFASAAQVMFQRSHEKGVVDIAITPDSAILITVSLDRTIKLWSRNGKLLKTIALPDEDMLCAAVSQDGRRFAAGTRSGAREYGMNGDLIRRITADDGCAHIIYTPNGVLTTSGKRTAALRDEQWNVRRTIDVSSDAINDMAVLPDGSFITVGDGIRSKDGFDAYVRMYDSAGEWMSDLSTSKPPRQGEKKKTFGERPMRAAVSVDGNYLALLAAESAVMIDRAAKKRRTFPVRRGNMHDLLFTPDGSAIILNHFWEFHRYAIDGTYEGTLSLRMDEDADAGGAVHARLAPDGSYCASGMMHGGVRIYDNSGALVHGSRPMALEANRLLFSPDGRTLFLEIKRGERTAAWDLNGMNASLLAESVFFDKNGTRYRIRGGGGDYGKMTVSAGSKETVFKGSHYCLLPDGTLLDKNGTIWGADGESIRRIAAMNPVWELAVEPSMRYFVTTPERGMRVHMHDTQGRHCATIALTGGRVEPGAVAAWRDHVAVGHEDGSVSVHRIDVSQFLTDFGNDAMPKHKRPKVPVIGTEILRIKPHLLSIHALAFSPDGKFLAVSSFDRTLRIVNIAARTSIAMAVLTNFECYAYDDNGRFDCSSAARDHIHFVRGLSSFDTRQMWDVLFAEGLVPKFLGGERSSAPDLSAAVSSAPYVSASVTEAEGGRAVIRVCAKPRSSGVGDMFIIHNGRVLDERSRGISIVRTGECRDFTCMLTPGRNELRGAAFDGSRIVYGASDPVFIRYDAPVEKRPALHILAAGVSEYRDAKLRLVYPSKDARAAADALKRSAASLYGDIHSVVLTDADAGKADLLRAVRELGERTEKNDAAVIFLAGHGDTENDVYYFLPADADASSLSASAVSIDEIGAVTRTFAANKILLLFDTCKSGAAAAAMQRLVFSRARGEQKLMARLANDQGIAVFSASSASQEAFEIRELAHGIFTYCLIQALRQPESSARVISAAGLLAQVNRTTRETAERYLKVQQSPIVYLFGDDFSIAAR